MITHVRRVLAVAATLVVLLALMPGVAQAGLDEAPIPSVGTTKTNPNPPADDASYAQVWWRHGWGTSLEPEIAWNAPASTVPSIDGQILGQLYTVDRNPGTLIDTTTPYAYSRSVFGNTGAGPYGTNFKTIYGMLGILANDPTSSTVFPGATRPIEGVWFIHAKYFSTVRYSNLTMTVPIGIDITPPRPVSGLQVSTGPGQPALTGVVETTRAHLTWTPAVHDDLSGDAYYRILLDNRSLDETEQGRVYASPDPVTNPSYQLPSSFTIEDMPAGRHKLSVVVVDRATNSSTATSTFFWSDPDIPTIKFGSFSRTVGAKPHFTVVAADKGGMANVRYTLDGNLLGNQTVSPFSISPDLSGYANGAHTLTATAFDEFGHTAAVSTTITLDKSVPVISSFSRTPAIFYPILRDGYFDNSTIKFKLNKAATVTLRIRNSHGTVVRSIKKSVGSGASSMTWNGKWTSDGLAHTGTYTYQLTAVDSIGNKTTSGKLTTTIRNYQLKRLANNTIKVIPR